MPNTHFTPDFKETVVVVAAVEAAGIDLDPESETFGHFIVLYRNGSSQDLGVVTAYAAAVNKGYTGTEEQWNAELANILAYATGKKYEDGVQVDLESGDTGYHNNAKWYSDQAEVSATNANNSASTATQDALKSEGYAAGTQNGTAVSSGTYYQNNTAYFFEQTSTNSLKSEGYAIGNQNGAPVESGSPYYQNNAKYLAEQALSSQNKAERYALGTENGIDAAAGTIGYQNNASYYSRLAAADALKSEGYATGTQNGTAVTSGSPYYENNAERFKDLAQAAYTSLSNLTVHVNTGAPDTAATVSKSVIDGHDDLLFTIPRGTPFTIFKTYASVAAMKADMANVAEGRFVMIATTVEEPDNSKMFVRTSEASDPDLAFSYLADFSGATGVQGPIAVVSQVDVSYQNSTSSTSVPTGAWSSSSTPVSGQYTWTKIVLTWNDANATTTTYYNVVYNGLNGEVTAAQLALKADKANTVLDSTLSCGRVANSTVGTNSIAYGSGVTASGIYSQSFGFGSTASGEKCHAEGANTEAAGDESHAEGIATHATGNYSHTEGGFTTASNDATHAEGYHTTASALYSHAEGYYSEASGARSHAEGSYATSSGGFAHAEGLSTTASGSGSHAEGEGSTASASDAHAEGIDTIANLTNMHASGAFNVAGTSYPVWVSGTNYTVGDCVTHTDVYNTFARNFGYRCETANSDSSFTASKWTRLASTGDTLFVVGNGADDDHRSNAMHLDNGGNVEFAGDVIAKGCGGANPVNLSAIQDISTQFTSAPNSFNLGAVNAYRNGNIISILFTIPSLSPTAEVEIAVDIVCDESLQPIIRSAGSCFDGQPVTNVSVIGHSENGFTGIRFYFTPLKTGITTFTFGATYICKG